MSPTAEEIKKEIRKNLAERVRFLSAGVLATAWALLTAESSKQILMTVVCKRGLLCAALLAVITLLFDFLQELFEYADMDNWFVRNYRISKLLGPMKLMMFRFKLVSVCFDSTIFIISISVILAGRVQAAVIPSPWGSLWQQRYPTSSPLSIDTMLLINFPVGADGQISGSYVNENLYPLAECSGHEIPATGSYQLTLTCSKKDKLDGTMHMVKGSWIYEGSITGRGRSSPFIFYFNKYDPQRFPR